MKRGEIWTVAGGPDYVGKPRPAVVVQDDSFDDLQSVTICLFTTVRPRERLPHREELRPEVAPSESNALAARSYAMIDKISTVPASKLGARIGRLDRESIVRIEKALILFLGLGTADA